MFKHRIALVLFVLTTAYISPTVAQTPQGTNVGRLSCAMSPSIGLIIGSRQRVSCRFASSGPYPPETYVGVINSIGLDIGITAGGAMAWAVFAPTAGPMRGGLAGT
ncbi:MAG: DUF992 domain-containing protein, partial [Pseudolabrys sp.]